MRGLTLFKEGHSPLEVNLFFYLLLRITSLIAPTPVNNAIVPH